MSSVNTINPTTAAASDVFPHIPVAVLDFWDPVEKPAVTNDDAADGVAAETTSTTTTATTTDMSGTASTTLLMPQLSDRATLLPST